MKIISEKLFVCPPPTVSGREYLVMLQQSFNDPPTKPY